MNGDSYLLDTNIVIRLLENESTVVQKIKSYPTNIFIPTIVIGELFFGAELSTKKDENRKKVDDLAQAS